MECLCVVDEMDGSAAVPVETCENPRKILSSRMEGAVADGLVFMTQRVFISRTI